LLINEGPDVECTSWENEDYSYTKWETPLGTKSQKVIKTEHGCSWYLEEFLIKTIKDIEVWEYILTHFPQVDFAIFLNYWPRVDGVPQ